MGESLVFGYRHVIGIPLCPCKDPGNYLMMEENKEALTFTLTCWCGSKNRGKFDSEEERVEFLKQNGIED